MNLEIDFEFIFWKLHFMMFGENDDKEKKIYKLSIPVKKKVDEK